MSISVENGAVTLKQARTFRAMSQGELSRLSGVSVPTISRIENGYHNVVSFNVAHALCDALGIRITDILWPFGLSEKGNALFGWSRPHKHDEDSASASQKCLSCFTVLPLSGQCDFCD